MGPPAARPQLGPKARKSARHDGAGHLAPAVAIALLAAIIGLVVWYDPLGWRTPAVLRPLRAPRLKDLPQFTTNYKDAMLWGSYRSGLYFGMRTRSPRSLLTGLIWFDPDSPETLMNKRARHQASQQDGLERYGWVRHDGRTWGHQVLVDGGYNISITMVKSRGTDGHNVGRGGDWAVRVNVTRATTSGAPKPRRISLVMYIADEDVPKAPWVTLPHGEPDSLRDGVTLVRGGNAVVGGWSLHARDVGPPRKRPPSLHYLVLPGVEQGQDLKLAVREVMLDVMYQQLQRNPTVSDRFHLVLPNGVVTGADMGMFQVTMSVGSCLDFVFLSHGKGSGAGSRERLDELSGQQLTTRIQQLDAQFNDRFDRVFPAAADDGLAADDGAPSPATVREVAKAALSNLLGSIGYFYGSSQVRVAGQEAPAAYWLAALFTATPSRSFFPRGFLWDEGFHQLLVARWDPLMSRDIIAHWLDLLNAQGWIPREQILGAEARARVPAEFVVQDPAHANPPSMFLPIAAMAQQLQHAGSGMAGTEGSGELSDVRDFLAAAWPRLHAWYNWFNTTQAGLLPGSYRWRGRDGETDRELNPKTLTSGLDDYPRASHPTEDERHLDLRCWMALASQAMASIGSSLGLPPAVTQPYRDTHTLLSDLALLDQLHWDEAAQQYLDWGLHSQGVRLQKQTARGPNGQRTEVVVRVVLDPPQLQFVPHFGYVSLFPLLMHLLPADSPRLGAVLSGLRDERQLWTPYGLRSLAASSTLYRQYNTAHDPPYWRGQVWVNINYLALAALRHYALLPGPYQQAAGEALADLQAGITQNLVAQYTQRGYLYEQYDDRDGRGVSSHPFTGWTALVALIATGAF